VAEWIVQAQALDAVAVVVAEDPPGDSLVAALLERCPCRVVVVGDEVVPGAVGPVVVEDLGNGSLAARFDVAMRLAFATNAPLSVGAPGRPVPHRVQGWVRAARTAGLRIGTRERQQDAAPHPLLVTTAAGHPRTSGAAVAVREGRNELPDVLETTLDLLTARTPAGRATAAQPRSG
jgi:hypothetical protein